MTKLNREEQEILDSYERDKWLSVITPEGIADLKSYFLNDNTEEPKLSL